MAARVASSASSEPSVASSIFVPSRSLLDITSQPPSAMAYKVSLARGRLGGPRSALPETSGIGAPRFASGWLVALKVRRNLTHQVAHEVSSTRADELDDPPLPKTRQGIEYHLVHPRAEPQQQRNELSGGGLPWPPIRLRRLKADEELALLLEAEDGEHRLAASVDGQHLHPSVRPCGDQPERSLSRLVFRHLCHLLGGNGNCTRTAPHEVESSTNVSSPRLRLSVPPVHKGQVSDGQD